MLSVEWKQTVEYPGTWDLQKLTKSEIKQKRSNVKFNAKERTFKSPGRKCLPHFGLKAKVMAEQVITCGTVSGQRSPSKIMKEILSA